MTSPQTETVYPNGYIPKNKRKTILFLSDDMRLPSGIGVMSKEIILNTCHKFNWVQLGSAVQHPEQGNKIDMSVAVSKESGVPDAKVTIYPYSGYGDPNVIRRLIKLESIDGILHFTDPRFWIWLYNMEHEIRQKMPLMYYHVWDNLPYPKYNELYYRSCDSIITISKQTYNIVRQVCRDAPIDEIPLVFYVPHGINPSIWKNYRNTEEGQVKIDELRKMLLGENHENIKFVVFYNNRNIRRKMAPDIINAYATFLHRLPEDKRDECRLVMHTDPVDGNGTDLPTYLKDVHPDVKVIFSGTKVPAEQLALLYNISDVCINASTAEGFGLSTLEAIMCETMIIATVTGGLQDQMGFVDDEGTPLDKDIHFNYQWGTNADGKYRKHGPWVIPLYPQNRSIIGSPPTPYIYEDRIRWEDVTDALLEIHELPPEERDRRGKLGRQWAIESANMTSSDLGDSMADCIDETFKTFVPRKKFGIYT